MESDHWSGREYSLTSYFGYHPDYLSDLSVAPLPPSTSQGSALERRFSWPRLCWSHSGHTSSSFDPCGYCLYCESLKIANFTLIFF